MWGSETWRLFFFLLLCYFCDLETKLFLITRDFLYTSELQTRGNFMLWVKLYRAIPPPPGGFIQRSQLVSLLPETDKNGAITTIYDMTVTLYPHTQTSNLNISSRHLTDQFQQTPDIRVPSSFVLPRHGHGICKLRIGWGEWSGGGDVNNIAGSKWCNRCLVFPDLNLRV